jgi:hypothetical protein
MTQASINHTIFIQGMEAIHQHRVESLSQHVAWPKCGIQCNPIVTVCVHLVYTHVLAYASTQRDSPHCIQHVWGRTGSRYCEL